MAEESRIIRKEEKKCVDPLRERLYWHRIYKVRREARATHLAYAYLNGRKYREVERMCYALPDVKKIESMVKRYGLIEFDRDWLKDKVIDLAA